MRSSSPLAVQRCRRSSSSPAHLWPSSSAACRPPPRQPRVPCFLVNPSLSACLDLLPNRMHRVRPRRSSSCSTCDCTVMDPSARTDVEKTTRHLQRQLVRSVGHDEASTAAQSSFGSNIQRRSTCSDGPVSSRRAICCNSVGADFVAVDVVSSACLPDRGGFDRICLGSTRLFVQNIGFGMLLEAPYKATIISSDNLYSY